MPWMKVDDGLHATRKVVRIPRRRRMAAMGLWIIAASWSAANLTDGCLDDHEVDELGGTSEQAQWLVDVGLWERTDTGYRFHDWSDYQPTRAEVLAKREAEAERKRQARQRPRGQRADSDRTNDGRRADTDGAPAGQVAESEHPDPTRPDPTPETPNGVSRTARAVLETAFADAWAHWPKKVERKQALERFVKATKRLDINELVPEIIRFGDAYTATTETQYVPALGVWLNGDRWTDELPGTQRGPQQGRPDPDAWMNR